MAATPTCRRGFLFLMSWALVAGNGLAGAAEPLAIKSPSGEVAMVFSLTAVGEPQWRITYRGHPVLADSRLGLEVTNGPSLDKALGVVNSAVTSHDETWKPVAGERSEVRNHYNQLVVDLKGVARRRAS